MRYPTPPAGRALRLAFVGRRSRYEPHALGAERTDIDARFLDFAPEDDPAPLTAALGRLRPHAVVVFEPQTVPVGALRGVRAPVLGVVTPGVAADGASLGVDRVVVTAPGLAEGARFPIWRSLPLPVDDRLFADVRPVGGRPRVLCLGAPTDHRERLLGLAKAEHGALTHVPEPPALDALGSLLADHDIGISLHDHALPAFDERLLLHLAAGHLVLAEAQTPQRGLERGIDYVEVAHEGGLSFLLAQIERFPRMWHRVRVRGRLKAEQFRSSRVWPRLVEDLHRDLAAFGTTRAVG